MQDTKKAPANSRGGRVPCIHEYRGSGFDWATFWGFLANVGLFLGFAVGVVIVAGAFALLTTWLWGWQTSALIAVSGTFLTLIVFVVMQLFR